MFALALRETGYLKVLLLLAATGFSRDFSRCR